MSDDTQNPQVPGYDPNSQGPAIPPPPAFPGAQGDAPAFPGGTPDLPQPQFGAQQPQPQQPYGAPQQPQQPPFGTQPQQPYGAPDQSQFGAPQQPQYTQPQYGQQQPVTTGFEQNPFGASATPYGSDAQPTEQYTQPYGQPYGQDQYGQPYGGGAGGQYPGGPQYPQGGGEPPKKRMPAWLWIVIGVAVLAIVGLVVALIFAFSPKDGGGDAEPKPKPTATAEAGGEGGEEGNDPEPEETEDGGDSTPSGKKIGIDDEWDTPDSEFVLKSGSDWSGKNGMFDSGDCSIFTFAMSTWDPIKDERKATEDAMTPIGKSKSILDYDQVTTEIDSVWIEDANGNQVEFLARYIEISTDMGFDMTEIEFVRVSASAEQEFQGTYQCYDKTDIKKTVDVIGENIVLKESD